MKIVGILLIFFFILESNALRCYTDLEASQVNHLKFTFNIEDSKINLKASSVECGMATGCVKILKKALDFDYDGKYIPEHKRGPDVDLFR